MEVNERCFALRKNRKRASACVCLEGGCPGHAVCPFYKPVWKHEHEIEKKYAKLAALPEMEQLRIAQKYYKGHMPWRRDAL